VGFGIGRVATPSSLMWMPHAKQHGSEPCPLIQRCLPLDADSMRSVHQATPGENEGRSSAHAPSLFRCIPVNGSAPMRAEAMVTIKESSLWHARAITTYLGFFALPAQVALIRLDGQYGDAVAIAQLIEAGVHLVTRARGYRVLEHPQIQRVLAHPATARVTRVNSDEEVELFDGGWLQLDEVVPQTRIIVARHRAPAAGKRVSVGKCIGEWV